MKALKKVLLDIIPVIVGVLIALFVNDLKQNKEDKDFIGQMLNSIDDEMQLNKEDFDSTLIAQQALIDTIKTYVYDEKVSIRDILVKEGIKVPLLKNSIWKSFNNSKIELIDFKLVSVLTEIEEQRVFMNMVINGINNFSSDYALVTESDKKILFIMRLEDLIDLEKQVIGSFSEYQELRKI